MQVQVRQKTNQKKTLYYLEQILLKYDATKDCVGIKASIKGSRDTGNYIFSIILSFQKNRLFDFLFFLQMGWIFSLVLNHMHENWWIFFNLWYHADTILQKSWYHTTKTVTLTTINMYLVLKLYPFVKITWFVCQSDLLDR